MPSTLRNCIWENILNPLAEKQISTPYAHILLLLADILLMINDSLCRDQINAGMPLRALRHGLLGDQVPRSWTPGPFAARDLRAWPTPPRQCDRVSKKPVRSDRAAGALFKSCSVQILTSNQRQVQDLASSYKSFCLVQSISHTALPFLGMQHVRQ